MKGVFFFSILALSVALVAPASADTAAPMRHLTYAFTFGAAQSVEVHNSGFGGNGGDTQEGGGSGVDSYSNHAGARGTIDVNILREQPDHGLVLSVSENSDNVQRKAAAATCVVWGVGTVVCDPNATINPEEYSVIRLLGANFVDPSLIDAHQHWQVSSSGASDQATSDYTILKNEGGVMSISEDRKVSYAGERAGTGTVNSTITYDFTRQVPLSLDEMTKAHPMVNGSYVDSTITVTAKLTNDSLLSTNSH